MRILVYNHDDTFAFDLPEADVHSLIRTEELNGQNCLDVTTTYKLEREQRILLQDAMGKWREYVVNGIDEVHQNSGRVIGTYNCVWSLQHDLAVTVVDMMPGVQNPVKAAVGLEAALSGTTRWSVGTVTQNTSGGVSMYYVSGWEALGLLVDTWGGEVGAEISVDKNGVVSRKVSLLSQTGKTKITRRFDYAADITSIRRKIDETPIACRVIPRGKGEETDSGGYGRKITIESVNGGKNYLQNDQTAPLLRLPDGKGGWEYPTVIIENGDIEDPAELKAWAQRVMDNYTTFRITYEASVLQFQKAGMNAQGVSLGDLVQCVDKTFTEGGLRVEGRIVRLVTNELADWDVQVTIGQISESFAKRVSNLSDRVSRVSNRIEQIAEGTQTAADVLSDIINTLNEAANASGGYVYYTDGEGIRTYDKAVSDPLVGTEADQVTELKGGTIRFANTRTSSGEWDWRTVIVSGHIASDMVTTAKLTSGFIGSPSGNFWNLDTGELQIANTATFVDKDGNPIEVDDIVDLANDISEIEEKATKAAVKAADSKVKDLTVGGTNLLTGTNKLAAVEKNPSWNNLTWGGTSSGTGTRNVVNITDAPNNQIKRGFAIAGNNTKNDVQQSKVPMTYGVDYIISCYAKATNNNSQLYMAVGNKDTWKAASVKATTSWQRYYMKFQADVNGADVTDGKTTVVFGNHGTSGTLYICGMKLERGNVATDWSENPYDTETRAINAAEEALNKANTYTNQISEKDRQYTAAQRKALDESLNQAQIFKRLTNNGKTQGIYLNNGLVYINGSYIRSGTIDAGIVKAGILKDAKGTNQWNMATGYLATKNMVATNANITGQIISGPTNGERMALQNGRLDGFHRDKKNTRVSYIAPTAKVWDKGTKSYRYGMQLQAMGIIRISSPVIGVLNSADTSKTTTNAFTGTITLKNVVFGMNSSMTSCKWGNITLKFVNGLLVTYSKPSGM